ncbi:hypothetical protein Tco_0173124 [Tanacetum coccineum]
MNGVISGRDVVIVVASVLIGGVVTSDDGLVDETSVKGAITGGVDVTVMMTWIQLWWNQYSSLSSRFPLLIFGWFHKEIDPQSYKFHEDFYGKGH